MITQRVATSWFYPRVDRVEKQFRKSPWTLMGLDAGWEGDRYLSDPYELGHSRGDIKLFVEVSPASLGFDYVVQIFRFNRLMAHREPPISLGLDEPNVQGWPLRITILVDGVPVKFHTIMDGDDWVGIATMGNSIITLAGYGFPIEDVSLATVTDLRPYVEGYRRMVRPIVRSLIGARALGVRNPRRSNL
jgi:hypothetical protein